MIGGAGGSGDRPFKFLVCVDASPRSRAALRFAARRARQSQGRIGLLHVIDPPDFQHWMTVAADMEEERREEAERLLHELSDLVLRIAGVTPELHIRVGGIGDEILALVRDDPDIGALVVGAAPPSARRGRLISWLAAQLAGNLEIPLVIVPGNLTDEQIDRMT